MVGCSLSQRIRPVDRGSWARWCAQGDSGRRRPYGLQPSGELGDRADQGDDVEDGQSAASFASSSCIRALKAASSSLSCYGFAGLRLHPLLVRDRALLFFDPQLLALVLQLLHSLLVLDLSPLVVDDGSPVQQLLLFEKAAPTEKTSSTPKSAETRATRSSRRIYRNNLC